MPNSVLSCGGVGHDRVGVLGHLSHDRVGVGWSDLAAACDLEPHVFDVGVGGGQRWRASDGASNSQSEILSGG